MAGLTSTRSPSSVSQGPFFDFLETFSVLGRGKRLLGRRQTISLEEMTSWEEANYCFGRNDFLGGGKGFRLKMQTVPGTSQTMFLEEATDFFARGKRLVRKRQTMEKVFKGGSVHDTLEPPE
eukprot:jgi/Botrbrau1/9583/Bobra.106_2s0007.1